MFCIENPNPADDAAIDALLDLSFGPGRLSKQSYRYRDGVAELLELSRVARWDGRLVGTIRYWPILINGCEALLLGPVAVCPRLRGHGIGQALIRQTLAAARTLGHDRVVLVGDADYYGQFGFISAAEVGIAMANEPSRLMAKALRPGAFDEVVGVVTAAR